MIDLKRLQETDPLKRMVEKQTEQEEFSPMNPPDAYAPPAIEPIPYEELPAFLQQLVDEHNRCREELEAFEQVLNRLKEVGLRPDREVEQGVQRFFRFLDEHIVPHNIRKRNGFFPRCRSVYWTWESIAKALLPPPRWICWRMITSS